MTKTIKVKGLSHEIDFKHSEESNMVLQCTLRVFVDQQGAQLSWNLRRCCKNIWKNKMTKTIKIKGQSHEIDFKHFEESNIVLQCTLRVFVYTDYQ
jgi:hypothetical protein